MEASSTNKPRPDRSAFAYVLALTIVCGVLLFLAPAVLVLLGVLAAFVLAVVWVKAGLRTGIWFFLRPASALNMSERSAWTASAVIVLFGLAAAAYSSFLVGLAGNPLRLPLSFGDPSVGARAVTYSDPQTQEALKRGLDASGVPHRVEKRDDGKEWISWAPKDNDAAEQVVRAVVGEPLPTGRNLSLGDSRHEEEFISWLSKRGVPNRRVMSHGKFFVVWEGDETSEELMQEFLRDQTVSAQTRQQDCPKSRSWSDRWRGEEGLLGRYIGASRPPAAIRLHRTIRLTADAFLHCARALDCGHEQSVGV
jgi:hypothetical protein